MDFADFTEWGTGTTKGTNGGSRMGYDSGMDDVLARLHVTEAQIAAYCRKWAIVRFELFGSALRADFDEQSDVDVLVTFGPEGKSGIGELLDMEDELQILFGRHTDLVARHLIETSRNWVRRRNILQSAQLLYAAA